MYKIFDTACLKLICLLPSQFLECRGETIAVMKMEKTCHHDVISVGKCHKSATEWTWMLKTPDGAVKTWGIWGTEAQIVSMNSHEDLVTTELWARFSWWIREVLWRGFFGEKVMTTRKKHPAIFSSNTEQAYSHRGGLKSWRLYINHRGIFQRCATVQFQVPKLGFFQPRWPSSRVCKTASHFISEVHLLSH